MAVTVDSLLQQFHALSVEQQMKVAEAIDRLTWAKRWTDVCERIAAQRRNFSTPSDEQIDDSVQAVRREKPLSARSLTPPS